VPSKETVGKSWWGSGAALAFDERTMKPKITVITLGVDDLEASLRFYRDGLGFSTEGIIGEQFEHGPSLGGRLEPGLVGLNRSLGSNA
jgi:glyoxalase/bleomycin resistance protein/dioxygenase superfamily protein